MLEIDGSHGEGGGQILRSALAMAMVKKRDIKVRNIRANRPNPGLSHQHLKAIEAASEICNSETEGVKKGSTEITFKPGEVKGGVYNFDIGTAGSVTLLLQALIPPAVFANEQITIKVRGGTDVKWSPPYDYFENVFLELLRRMDIDINSELIKRGHYPKGGGKVKIVIEPTGIGEISLDDQIDRISGRAFVTELPDHIAERMKKQVLKEFIDIETSISIDDHESASAGTGIVIWTEGGKVLGKGMLGEKGVPAEKVGKEAAEGLRKDLEAGVDLDPNAADQMIPLLALSDGEGCLTTRKLTGHLETNVWLVNQFVEDKVELSENGDKVEIRY